MVCVYMSEYTLIELFSHSVYKSLNKILQILLVITVITVITVILTVIITSNLHLSCL